jgi:hypothetical protein
MLSKRGCARQVCLSELSGVEEQRVISATWPEDFPCRRHRCSSTERLGSMRVYTAMDKDSIGLLAKVRSRVMLKTLEPVDEADTHFRLGADYLVVMMIVMMICKRW